MKIVFHRCRSFEINKNSKTNKRQRIKFKFQTKDAFRKENGTYAAERVIRAQKEKLFTSREKCRNE